jgi:hypothetical protein
MIAPGEALFGVAEFPPSPAKIISRENSKLAEILMRRVEQGEPVNPASLFSVERAGGRSRIRPREISWPGAPL